MLHLRHNVDLQSSYILLRGIQQQCISAVQKQKALFDNFLVTLMWPTIKKMLSQLCMDLLDAVIDGQLWQKQGNIKCPRKNSTYRSNCLYNNTTCTIERSQGMD